MNQVSIFDSVDRVIKFLQALAIVRLSLRAVKLGQKYEE
ncbi:hypothetical protein JOD20_001841 [Herpetosiphon giganteus]|nr:hypothetical protein [Herpetosiphon giganteus]